MLVPPRTWCSACSELHEPESAEVSLEGGRDAATRFRRCHDSVAPHPVDEHRVDLWTVCSAAAMLLLVGGRGLSPQQQEKIRAVTREVLDETLARLARH